MAAAATLRLDAPELVQRLRGFMLWLTGLSGAFVFMEPSPYEFVALAAMLMFFATGLPLRRDHTALLLLLLAYGVGLSIGLMSVLAQPKTVIWTGVSWFLIGTALFYACALAEDTGRRLQLLLEGYMVAAMIVAALAIAAYFRVIPGADEFLLYGRAKGTFNDPNVLGPFLVLPTLLAMRRALHGGARNLLAGGGKVALLVLALILTFSRGAWAHLALSAALFAALMFAVSSDARERTRIALASLAVFTLLALALTALLTLTNVGAQFADRASLGQSYDVGYLGRFGRHALGALLALDHPFGIGPRQFWRLYGEDPHNVYLNAFMAGGWLAGTTYVLLIVMTMYVGIKGALARTPWRPILLATLATFIGVVIEGAVIDTDHWRHFWLLLGVLWGGAIAARRVAPSRMRPYSPATGRSVAQPG